MALGDRGAAGANVNLDTTSERVAEGEAAGDLYTAGLENIRNDLDATDGSGSQLGTMVGAQLELVGEEQSFNVRKGIPNKVNKEVNKAAQAVNQAASS